jgi:hypothetical protein
MESRDEEVKPQLLPDVQVVASCDSSGVTFINEGTPLHLAENGLYEIAYINISEEDMISELELMESVNNDDDSSRQSFPDHYEVEEVDDDGPANTDDADLLNPDEEQIAITGGYLEGIVSFQDFMTRVENSDGSESGMEDSSDTDDEEEALERNQNDPEYLPEGSSKVQAKQKLKSSEHKGSGALIPESKGNFAGGSSTSFSQQPPTTPVKKRKCTRVTKRLPANLQGNQIFFFC